MASGPPAQLVAFTEAPSSFAAVSGSGSSPVPPMPVILEPGIRAELPIALAAEDKSALPLLLLIVTDKEGATSEEVSAPMHGAFGTMSAGTAAMDVAATGSTVPLLPGGIAPSGLLPSAAVIPTVDNDGVAPQAWTLLVMPDVEAAIAPGTPDIVLAPTASIPAAGSPAATGIPDKALNPPPSKTGRVVPAAIVEQLLEPDPKLSGEVAAIAEGPPIELVCERAGPAQRSDKPAIIAKHSLTGCFIWRSRRDSADDSWPRCVMHDLQQSISPARPSKLKSAISDAIKFPFSLLKSVSWRDSPSAGA
jgi:hypothetical protein